MKTIKILIVVAIVAALGFGIYKVFENPTPTEPPTTDTGQIITAPPNDWIQQSIDSSYHAVPLNDFVALQKCRADMQLCFDDIMSDSSEICRKTVKLMLRNGYQSRLIQMADSEFTQRNWPNCRKIKEMSSQLLSELRNGIDELRQIDPTWSPDTAALDSIIVICNEYQKVYSYYSSVINQSNQRPSWYRSKWDFGTTEWLIQNTPTASAPVNKTTIYQSSCRDNVIESLYKGHVKFLDKLVYDIAKEEIRRKPTKDSVVCSEVSKEIRNFDSMAYNLYRHYYDKRTIEYKAQSLYKTLDDYKEQYIKK